MKALNKLAVLLVLVSLAVGCSTIDRRDARPLASVVNTGLRTIGRGYEVSKRAEVANEAIRAQAALEAACRLGGKGTAGYESSAGGASVNADAGYTPEQCAEIRKAQIQAGTYAYPSYSRSGYGARGNPYAICFEIHSINGQDRCLRDVDRQINRDIHRRAIDAARNR